MTRQCARVLSSVSNRLPIIHNYCPSIICPRLSGNYIHTKAQHEGERGLKISSKMIEVVGNGADGCCRSVLLRIGDSRILFNVGESTDNSMKGLINGVFVTHLDWRNIGGLVGLIYKSKSSHRESFFLCGPPGLNRFMSASGRFLMIKNFKIHVLDSDSISQSMQSNFHISCVAIRDKSQANFQSSPLNKSWLKKNQKYPKLPSFLIDNQPSETVELNTSYSYICRSEKHKSWILSECAKLGIKPGEDMKKLWMGEDVVLETGAVVKPEDVIRVDSCANVIVIDCPSDGYLDDLLGKKDYTDFYQDEGLLMVHFTPSAVMQDERYVSWMKQFSPSAKHLIVNDANEWDGIKKVYNRQQVCRLISTKFFPKLRPLSHPSRVNATTQLLDGPAVYVDHDDNLSFKEDFTSEKWLQKWCPELRGMQLLQCWYGTLINLQNLVVLRANHPFTISHIPEEDSTYFKEPSTLSPNNPRITFLGTGAQGASLHRNTSGILVQISEDNAFLMDSGDGIINSFTTLYERDELQKVLTSIRLIYISHTHADHHSGLFGILRAIKEAWASLEKKPRKVILLFPPPLIEWFEAYHNKFETLFDNVILIDLNQLISSTSSVEDRSQLSILFNRMLGFKHLQVCWAIHSRYSYCLSIKHTAGWKISYSGDTKLCQKFIEIGKNSDVLIHEATFSSGLDKHATMFKHSTTEEAIRAGIQMSAKHLILTHFSKRYPVVPCLSDLYNSDNVSVAFDFLQVALKDLHILPKLNAAYEVVFDEYLKAAEEVRSRQRDKQVLEDEDLSEPEEPDNLKSVSKNKKKK